MHETAYSSHETSDARLILCSGMFSSGSTWLYNIVYELIAHKSKDLRIARFYAETLNSFPEDAWDHDYIVVKNHHPDTALIELAAERNAPILLTVRDPKDAAASLMTRFLHPANVAAQHVINSARRLIEIRPDQIKLLLHYEDQFTRDVNTIHRISECLQIELSDEDARAIFEKFTPQRVQESIARLEEEGVFQPGLSRAAQHDPATHWHPGHIGDGRIGKFETLLSEQQQIRISHETNAYARTFDYPVTWAEIDALQATQGGLIALLKRAGHDASIKAALDQADQVFIPTIDLDVNLGDWRIRYENDGSAILVLSGGDFSAHSHGRTAGFSMRVTDAFERAASGHKIQIRAVVRSSSAKTQIALAYSTNEVGNSGWRLFVTGPQWQVIEFEYAVPQMKAGMGDFIGLMPGPADRPAVEVCLVTARVVTDGPA